MKIATWNVNSLNVRLRRSRVAARAAGCAGAAGNQTGDETPRAEIEAAGYHAVYAGQKTYNGVACSVASRRRMS